MRTPALFGLTLAVSALMAPAVSAQDEPIQTDRPDITNTSKVVGPGVLQIETGVQRELFRTGRRSQRSWFTPTLLRWGVADRWEARVSTDGYSRARYGVPNFSDRTSGYSPVSVGAKYQFQDPPKDSRRPSLGAMFDIQVPSGSSIFESERVTGSFRLAADWELTDQLALTANLGGGVGEHENGAFGYPLATASLQYAVTRRLRPFVELAYQGAETGTGGKGLLFDGGLLYQLGYDTQLDFGIGTNLAGKDTPHLFWTVGLSHRFR